MSSTIKLLVTVLAIACTSFNLPTDTSHIVKIIESSTPLNTSEFLLKDGIIELTSSDDFVFYVEVTSKNVKGKKKLSNAKKVKRKGQHYDVTYTYKSHSSDIKRSYELYYIIWEDGEIFEVKPTTSIYVENIRLITEI